MSNRFQDDWEVRTNDVDLQPYEDVPQAGYQPENIWTAVCFARSTEFGQRSC